MSLSQFAQELLQRIPEDRRGDVSAVLEETPDAVRFLDEAALRQQDYSRNMDAVAETARKQREWYDRYIAANGQPPTTTTPAPTVPTPTTPQAPAAATLTRDEVLGIVNEREQGAVAFFATLNNLTDQHRHELGERLDTRALLADPLVQKHGLEEGYRQKYAERYAAKAATAEEARINAKVEERLAAERAAAVNRPPYPVSPLDVSPLDVLATPNPDRSQYSVEAAAAEYAQLAANHR